MIGSRKVWIASAALTLGAFVLVAALYGALPDPMPTHWAVSGEPDGFTPKPWGPFLLPLCMAGLLLLLAALPRISPRGYRMEPFAGVYGFFILLLTVFFFVLNALVLAEATGRGIGMDRAVGLLVGALFVVMGNYLPKVRRNFFLGIRTPWTLANEEVWAATHRVGGWIFVLGGAGAIVAALVAAPPWVTLALVLVSALAPAAYSFIAWRSLERTDGGV